MSAQEGFWSYVHADDEAEGGRIKQLAHDISSQFEMITGEPLSLFLDRDVISWGEAWRKKIDDSLSSVAFFIPVITPRYFKSAECRRELQFFARQFVRQNISELILPLLYLDVTSLLAEESTDELGSILKKFQWEDWRELRFAELSSENYRRGVARLAQRLVDINITLEKTTDQPEIERIEVDGDQEKYDEIDITSLATRGSNALGDLSETVSSIGEKIESVTQIMRAAGHSITNDGSERNKQRVAHTMSKDLAAPIEDIWNLSNSYVSHIHKADDAVRDIIQRAPLELKKSPELKKSICGFFKAIFRLVESQSGAFAALQGMVDAIPRVENMSRDLRPPLRRLRQGLTIMIEAREVNTDWVILIGKTGIVCDENMSP